ncbi:MAG: EAL domain-containing protein [Ruminococcus sp.]|jgi:diguanylate cyclase (GGDEF)-like protein|nr:EAL domain-containing protein [Ruminococcus sp.]
MKRVIRSSTSALLIACLLLFLAFTAFAYGLSVLSAETNIRMRTNDVGALAVGIVSDYLSEKEASVARMSDRSDAADFILALRRTAANVMNTGTYVDFQRLMSAAGNFDSDVKSAWALDAGTGNLVNGKGQYIAPSVYDARSADWFASARDSSAGYAVTEIYESIFEGSGEVFSVIKPVVQNGNVVGYFGIEISSSKISYMMDTYVSSEGSFPLIISDDHSVIYYPARNSAFLSRYSLDNPPISDFIAHTTGLSQLSNSFVDSDGETIYYYFDSYSIPNWSVLVVYDITTVGGNTLAMFGLEATVLLLMIALFFIIVNSILRDKLSLITPIARSLNDFANGNYKTRINSEKDGELGYASRAIDSLGKELSEKTASLGNLQFIDPTTGLFNRVKLYECIEEHIATRSTNHSSFAVLFIDLDNFKWLNETYGHKFGDDALSVFAKVLSDAVTPESQAFRFSGDEFIIVYDYDVRSDIDSFSNKMRAAFHNPFRVQNDKIFFRFSCGIALYPENGLTADDMLRQAASALSAAKTAGKNCSAFVPEDDGAGPKKAYIAQVLSHALHNRELYLNYQPIISMETGEIYGFEALIRWESAEFGNIPPADFIKVAEESGEIVQIGMWILENACRFIQRVNREYNREIVISVNVSPVQLRQHDYIEHIRNVLTISHINPANIQLEITEGNLVDFIDNRNETLEEVINTGITLALDDFGTGYSSMAYLKNLPVKCLKIDSIFMEGDDSEKSQAITASTIELVHSLGLIIVAEGIESREQFDRLKAMHCDYIQGYIVSKPLAEDKAIEFIPQYEQLHKVD